MAIINTNDLYFNKDYLNGDIAGTSEFGYTSHYFYMSSGLKVEDQKAYDES